MRICKCCFPTELTTSVAPLLACAHNSCHTFFYNIARYDHWTLSRDSPYDKLFLHFHRQTEWHIRTTRCGNVDNDLINLSLAFLRWLSTCRLRAQCSPERVVSFPVKNNPLIRYITIRFVIIWQALYWWPDDDSRTYGNSHELTAFCCLTTKRIGCSTPTSELSTLTAKLLLS